MRRRCTPTVLAAVGVSALPTLLGAQDALTAIHDVEVEAAALGEVRPIRVEVPPACQAGGCPLVVVLDAEFLLPVVSGVHDLLAHRYVAGSAPAVRVGIPNTDRMRDVTPTPTPRWPQGGGATDFIDWILDDALPPIAARWRTAGTPVLFGHSGGGLVVLTALVHRAAEFSALVALDPSAAWDDRVAIRRIRDGAGGALPPVTLDTYRLKPELGELVEVLGAIPELDFSVAVHQGESHQTLLIPALRRVLPLVLPPPAR